MKIHYKRFFAILLFLPLFVPLRGGCATISYQYDRLNRLTSTLYEDGTRIVYVYDAAGNRLSLIIGGCSENAGIKGDLDGDCAVSLRDATAALQALSGQEVEKLRGNFKASGAEVDGNMKIDLKELLQILQAVTSGK